MNTTPYRDKSPGGQVSFRSLSVWALFYFINIFVVRRGLYG